MRCRLIFIFFILWSFFLVPITVADDCEPKRACDATKDCSVNHDTRDCEPHWACPDCKWYDAFCHLKRVACESDKARFKTQCEVEKAAQNKIYEANKPVRLACEAGLDGPFSCSPDEVLEKLRSDTQDDLTDFDELSGVITTPIKKAFGQLSWRETACYAKATVIPYRNSRRSSDDFCTLDVQILSIDIQGHGKPPGDRFLRLEILPNSKASEVCRDRTLTPNDRINVGGMIKIDRHFPGKRWLEMHVQNDFAIVAPPSNPLPSGITGGLQSVISQYTVIKGDSLSTIAREIYGEPSWHLIYRANRKKIRNPDLIFPAQKFVIP